jgi:hypothetical protein
MRRSAARMIREDVPIPGLESPGYRRDIAPRCAFGIFIHWDLGFIWSLVPEIWDFLPPVLGIWNFSSELARACCKSHFASVGGAVFVGSKVF